MTSAILINTSVVNPFTGFIIPIVLVSIAALLLVVSMALFFNRFSKMRVANTQRIALFKNNWWKISVLFLSPAIITLFLIAGLFTSPLFEIYFYLYGLLITIIIAESIIISIIIVLGKNQQLIKSK
jgi:TRAP-type C4-dicarboxylate transport system permease large subunit